MSWTTVPVTGTGDWSPIPQRKAERQLSGPRPAAGAKPVQWRIAETVKEPPLSVRGKGRDGRRETDERNLC